MLNFHITRGNFQGTLLEVGWNERRWRFEPMSRMHAEECWDIPEGKRREDGRWLLIHKERHTSLAPHHWSRIGVGFGSRYWLFTREWPNPQYDSEEASQQRLAQARRRFTGRKAATE